MIPFKELMELAKALPKCGLLATGENYCWIIDKNGHKVGSVHFDTSEVVIFDKYKYSDQVREAIGEAKFKDMRKEFKTNKTAPIDTEGEPKLTDYGKALYG